jgi:hypothetical protein
LVPVLLVLEEVLLRELSSYVQPFLLPLGMFVLEHTLVLVVVLVEACVQRESVVYYLIGISTPVVHDVEEVHI